MKVKDYLEKVNNVELTDEQVQKINETLGIKESKVWKPKKNEGYYYHIFVDAEYTTWYGDDFDNERYEIGNYFKTREEAQFQVEKLKVIAELKRYALENNECELNWGERKSKYYIYCDCEDMKLRVNWVWCYKSNGIYFSSRDIAEKAIETIGEERLMKYYFEVEE
jgi:hypothetical protein